MTEVQTTYYSEQRSLAPYRTDQKNKHARTGEPHSSTGSTAQPRARRPPPSPCKCSLRNGVYQSATTWCDGVNNLAALLFAVSRYRGIVAWCKQSVRPPQPNCPTFNL
ncbi:unnamed protein product [Danaus chrysippus]|uniref:(African queen) hypothetical protein n=1 Tax=Danaus chrysippus TaxID=151541 RepID=A0A8J2WAQ6_9NEOP|nr:unnamed protein product [Danaus chrysippus]